MPAFDYCDRQVDFRLLPAYVCSRSWLDIVLKAFMYFTEGNFFFWYEIALSQYRGLRVCNRESVLCSAW